MKGGGSGGGGGRSRRALTLGGRGNQADAEGTKMPRIKIIESRIITMFFFFIFSTSL
jgi:hypothetical protein